MMKIKRLHLFEFEDLAWFPSLFRDYITGYLKYMLELGDFYQPMRGLLKEALIKTNCLQIIDLCSGSGGPIIGIQKRLKQEGISLKVLFTDKYPNKEVFGKLKSPDLNWVEESVDATNVPSRLKGFRTLFSSFHHFKPEQARNILEDAVRSNAPIGVFEFTERTLFNIFCAPFIMVLLHVFLGLFFKPYTFKRFFWTYLVPVGPLLCLWDGWVSILRTYTPEELRGMVNDIEGHQKFHWNIGKLKSKGRNITYLLGYPIID